MADSYTANLNLTLPEVGASRDTWGGKVNADMTAIDTVFNAAGNGTSVGLNVGAGKTLSVSGTFSVATNLDFSGTGRRITGDMSNATVADRLSFQSSTTNGNTAVSAIPNGTATQSTVVLYDNSNPTNSSALALISNTGEKSIRAQIAGTGSYLPMTFYTGGSERLRIDSSGNVGIGTSSPTFKLDVSGVARINQGALAVQSTGSATLPSSGYGWEIYNVNSTTNYLQSYNRTSSAFMDSVYNAATHQFYISGTERARITSGGVFLVGKTSDDSTVAGSALRNTGVIVAAATSTPPLIVNRLASDGDLVGFYQDTILEGSISVSGTTVSYNGGHLARWSQLLSGGRDPTLVKGTVLSNLNEMCEWLDEDGNPLPNEQLNRMKISDVEGDQNVAGVFVNWDNDDESNPYDMNIAMTGDMIIRIAQGVTVQRGDLLMSAGDGTAKPQGDDIVRSKTIAKVTSTHVTCTYEDGSYCVPCVLMAC